jgi:hypothetical protein
MNNQTMLLYDVHDLYFAAFCGARGLELREVYRRPDGFRFDSTPMPKRQPT